MRRMQSKKRDHNNPRNLANKVDDFYDSVLRMDADTFYRKYRNLHKEIVAQGSQETLLEYLRDIKDYYESKTNYDLQISLGKISSRLWQVPLVIGLFTVGLVCFQVFLERESVRTVADMISPRLTYEEYFPPEKIIPHNCTESEFVVINFGQSSSKYEISVRGNGFLISDACNQINNSEPEKSWKWIIPPNDKYSVTFAIWVDEERHPSTATLKIKMVDLKKGVAIFEKTYVYKRIDTDLQSSEYGYWYLLEIRTIYICT